LSDMAVPFLDIWIAIDTVFTADYKGQWQLP
jgi:hypothetical protein